MTQALLQILVVLITHQRWPEDTTDELQFDTTLVTHNTFNLYMKRLIRIALSLVIMKA